MTARALAGNGPGAEPEALIMLGSLRPQEPPHAQGRRLAAHGRATSPRSRLTARAVPRSCFDELEWTMCRCGRMLPPAV